METASKNKRAFVSSGILVSGILILFSELNESPVWLIFTSIDKGLG